MTLALNRLEGRRSLRLHRRTSFGQLFVRDGDANAAIRDVDFDDVILFDEGDVAAFGRLGLDVTDGKPRCAA